MLGFLIAIVLLIVGIFLMKYSGKGWDRDWAFFVGIVLVMLMSLFVIIGGLCVADTQINKEVTYQNKLHEKEMLEYRIDNMEENVVGNEMLYNDIVEFKELSQLKERLIIQFLKWAKDLNRHLSKEYMQVTKSLNRVRLFCSPMNCNLPGSSVHGIFQARILE